MWNFDRTIDCLDSGDACLQQYVTAYYFIIYF